MYVPGVSGPDAVARRLGSERMLVVTTASRLRSSVTVTVAPARGRPVEASVIVPAKLGGIGVTTKLTVVGAEASHGEAGGVRRSGAAARDCGPAMRVERPDDAAGVVGRRHVGDGVAAVRRRHGGQDDRAVGGRDRDGRAGTG